MRYRLIAVLMAAFCALGLLGATAASASTQPHATTVCNNDPGGTRCTNISSLLLNQGNAPSFIQNATGGQATDTAGDGRRVNLRPASDGRTNEDFQIHEVGTIGQLCQPLGTGVNGLDPTSYACLNYPSFYPVYQANFAPDSNQTGACVGAMSATQGFRVRLERCGTPRTFWVGDLASTITITLPGPFPLVYFPLEFAADVSASNPLVLTLNVNSTGVKNGLFLEQENTSGGSTADTQMFTLTEPTFITPVFRK